MERRIAEPVWDAEQFAVSAGEIEAKSRGVVTGEMEYVFGCLGVCGVSGIYSEFLHQFVHNEMVVRLGRSVCVCASLCEM